MKQTRRPCNIPTHRARRKHATDEAKPPPDVPTDRIEDTGAAPVHLEYEEERQETAAIAAMLTDKYDLYYLLGTARALLKMEMKKNSPVT